MDPAIPAITVCPPGTPSPPSSVRSESTIVDANDGNDTPPTFDRAPKHDFALQGFQTQDALNKLVHALSVHDIQQQLNSVRSWSALGPFNVYDIEPSSRPASQSQSSQPPGAQLQSTRPQGSLPQNSTHHQLITGWSPSETPTQTSSSAGAVTSSSPSTNFVHAAARGKKMTIEEFPEPSSDGHGKREASESEKGKGETKLEDTESDGTVKGKDAGEKKRKKKSKKKKKKGAAGTGVVAAVSEKKDEDAVERVLALDDHEVDAVMVDLTDTVDKADGGKERVDTPRVAGLDALVTPEAVAKGEINKPAREMASSPTQTGSDQGRDANNHHREEAKVASPRTADSPADRSQRNQDSPEPGEPGMEATTFPTPQISITVLPPDDSSFLSPERVTSELSPPHPDEEVGVKMPGIMVETPTRPSNDAEDTTESLGDQGTSRTTHSSPSTEPPVTPPPNPLESDDVVGIVLPESGSLAVERRYPLQDSWTLWFSDTSDSKIRPIRRSVDSPSAEDYSHGLFKIFTTNELDNFAGSWKALRRRIAEKKGRDIEPPGHPMWRGTEGLGMQALPDDSNFHFFLTGVQPMWEDPQCARGGKIMLSNSPVVPKLDVLFYETVLLLIGGSLYDHCPAPAGSDARVLGAVLSKRKMATRVEIWIGGSGELHQTWVSRVTQYLAGYFPNHKVYPYKAFAR